MSDSSKYYDHAEFLVARGYLEPGTDIDDLAKRLMEHDLKIIRNNIPRKEDVLTREKVYGENAELIGKMVESKSPEQKTLIEPGERESAALAKSRRDNKKSA
jgi:hypothetical protein